MCVCVCVCVCVCRLSEVFIGWWTCHHVLCLYLLHVQRIGIERKQGWVGYVITGFCDYLSFSVLPDGKVKMPLSD